MFPELTERSEVTSENFQLPDVGPIPDSPNLKICLVFIPYTEPYTVSLFAIYSSMFCQHFLGQKNQWALNTSLSTSRLPLLHFFFGFSSVSVG